MERIKQYMQEINMNWEYLSPKFLVAGIVLSISFFLIFISISKTYTSSMTIFVNAKSEIAAQQGEQIIGNIVEFPKTLALYDRLLKYNSDVKDLTVGKSSLERKEFWNSLLSVKKVGKNSSLIKISITTIQQNDAEQLAQKTVETLVHFTGFYYNIKNDVDLRIIDGPITHSNITGWYWIVPSSLILGFLITFFLQYILIKRKDFLTSEYNVPEEKFLSNLNPSTGEGSLKNSEQEDMRSLENLYMSDMPIEILAAPRDNSNETLAPKIQEMKKITKTFEKSKYPNFSEVPKHTQLTASAPDNLPVADDFNLNVEQPKQSEIIEIKEEPKIKIHPEPGEEQLKKRLNELLRGNL